MKCEADRTTNDWLFGWGAVLGIPCVRGNRLLAVGIGAGCVANRIARLDLPLQFQGPNMTGGHQHQAHKADYVYVLPSDVGHGTAAYPSLSGPGPSADDLEAVRALLLDKWREKVDTATLRRFLVAVGGHDKVAVGVNWV